MGSDETLDLTAEMILKNTFINKTLKNHGVNGDSTDVIGQCRSEDKRVLGIVSCAENPPLRITGST